MKFRRRRIDDRRAETSMSSQLMGLSLFIMLLAFFIVLNAISTFEQTKIRPVLSSLGTTFAARLSTMDMNEDPSMMESDDQSVYEGETLERLEALFSSQLPNYQAVVSLGRGVMHVRVPFEDFEAAVMAVGQRNALQSENKNKELLQGFFLPTMIALMQRERGTRAPLRMDMVLNIEADPAWLQNQEPQKLTALMQTIANAAEQIERAGLPEKLISAGLQSGPDGMLDITFQYHIPYNPLGKGGTDE